MRMLKFNGWSRTIAFAWTILLFAGLGNAQDNTRPNGDDDDKKSPTPPGLFITPTALKNAVLPIAPMMPPSKQADEP